MMFSQSVLATFALTTVFTQGSQLRGITRSRNLDEVVSSSCIPVGEAPFTHTAYVAVNLNGTQAFNPSTIDLFNLATTFELAYNELVDCSAIAGSRREVGRTNALVEAVGPEGVASALLQVEILCNACGNGDDVEMFRDSPTIQDILEDGSGVQCACEGPFIPSFVELYNTIFALTTSSNIGILDVDQLTMLNCGDQSITSYSEFGVCPGLDAQAFQVDETEFPPEEPIEVDEDKDEDDEDDDDDKDGDDDDDDDDDGDDDDDDDDDGDDDDDDDDNEEEEGKDEDEKEEEEDDDEPDDKDDEVEDEDDEPDDKDEEVDDEDDQGDEKEDDEKDDKEEDEDDEVDDKDDKEEVEEDEGTEEDVTEELVFEQP